MRLGYHSDIGIYFSQDYKIKMLRSTCQDILIVVSLAEHMRLVLCGEDVPKIRLIAVDQ